MLLWLLDVVLVFLTGLLATMEVFAQTATYERELEREVRRQNHLARLRGEPPIEAQAYRDALVQENLEAAQRAMQRDRAG